jgi:hypothetical protein
LYYLGYLLFIFEVKILADDKKSREDSFVYYESLLDFYYFKIKDPNKKYRPNTLFGMTISKEFRNELEKYNKNYLKQYDAVNIYYHISVLSAALLYGIILYSSQKATGMLLVFFGLLSISLPPALLITGIITTTYYRFLYLDHAVQMYNMQVSFLRYVFNKYFCINFIF